MDRKIAQDLLTFLDNSPTCFHAVEQMAGQLLAHGL